jgi:hypothetical protein
LRAWLLKRERTAAAAAAVVELHFFCRYNG